MCRDLVIKTNQEILPRDSEASEAQYLKPSPGGGGEKI